MWGGREGRAGDDGGGELEEKTSTMGKCTGLICSSFSHVLRYLDHGFSDELFPLSTAVADFHKV